MGVESHCTHLSPRKTWKLDLIFKSGTGLQDWYKVVACWQHLVSRLLRSSRKGCCSGCICQRSCLWHAGSIWSPGCLGLLGRVAVVVAYVKGLVLELRPNMQAVTKQALGWRIMLRNAAAPWPTSTHSFFPVQPTLCTTFFPPLKAWRMTIGKNCSWRRFWPVAGFAVLML